MTFLAGLLALGLLSGFIAGLLGVGGGLVLVPVLSWMFIAQGFPAQYNIHMALGTSLAVIMLTSISSLRAHHGHGAVRWAVVRRIAPGIVLGTLAGALVAAVLPDRGLKIFFIAFLTYAATQMWFGFKVDPRRALPGWPGMTVVGGFIGLISSWVGIGGGTLSVPFLNACNVRFQEAVGTSSAIGFPIAVAGALGYALAGWEVDSLPTYSLGFVYLPAFMTIAATSILSAPWGARMTHALPVHTLKRVFALLLYAIAAKMAYSLFGPA